ncbi:MAG: hypothetical protein ACRDT2_11860, partial [Natronosporangium sp.]
MRTVVAVAVRVGDFADALVAALQVTPRHVKTALATRRGRRFGVAAGLVALVLYLVAIGDIGVSPSGAYARFIDTPGVQVAVHWPATLFASRAPFLFEPAVAVYPLPQLALFVSPGNLLLGVILAGLLGLNVAAAYATLDARTCRRPPYARV